MQTQDTQNLVGLLRNQDPKNAFTPDNSPEKGQWNFPDIAQMAAFANVSPILVDQIFGECLFAFVKIRCTDDCRRGNSRGNVRANVKRSTDRSSTNSGTAQHAHDLHCDLVLTQRSNFSHVSSSQAFLRVKLHASLTGCLACFANRDRRVI